SLLQCPNDPRPGAGIDPHRRPEPSTGRYPLPRQGAMARPGRTVKAGYILTHPGEALVLGLEEDRGQGEHLGPDAGAVGSDDRPRRTSALVAVRPRKVEVMLVERHLHEDLLPVPKALQLEELLFDEPVKRLHVRTPAPNWSGHLGEVMLNL